MQPDVTPFFTIATTSSGLPSIAISSGRNIARADTNHHSAGLQGTGGTDRLGRFVQRACPHVRRDTTAYRGQRRRSTCQRARRIAFRWSSQNFANVTGVAISGRGATSALPAATSQTRRYFSISSIMNLPASAGSYSVLRHRKEAMTANTLFFITSEGGSCFANRFQNFE